MVSNYLLARLKLVALIAIAILSFVYVYRQHHRVVTDGTLLGLTIGTSKSETLADLSGRSDVSAIEPRVPEFYVTNDNLSALHKLRDVPNFVIEGQRFQARVSHAGGNITFFRHLGVGKGIQVRPTTIGELIGHLEVEFQSNPSLRVFAIAQPFGMTMTQYDLSNARIPNQRETDWLLTFDHWFFHLDGSYSNVNLFFERGVLAKIEYRNNFMELP